MRRRGWLLLGVLIAVLAVALIVGGQMVSPPASSPEMLLDAVLDRAGVTKVSEAVGWLALEEEGALDEVGPDTPVWVSRNGHRRFHSVPMCGGMRSPVRTTLEEALALGLAPCTICWEDAE